MTTFAMWSVQNDTVNAVSMGSVKVSVEEEYEQGQELMPGSTADKKAWARNTGQLDIAVRMKVTRLWGTEGTDGALIADHTLATDNIEIEFNLEDWLYNEDNDYFYYKGVLAPGEATPPLFEQFTLSPESGDKYRGKFANIIVTAECVQAQGNGISLWGVRFEDLGVTYHAPASLDIVTHVNFLSPSGGFAFPDNQGDLFAEFKLLAPGESRSQTVEVKNAWSRPVEIFLWAEVTAQHASMQRSLDLVDKLLKDYTELVITHGGVRIYQGAVWGSPDLDSRAGDSMRYPYSLGTFQPGETKTLQLELILDPAMDNRFNDLIGLIDWVFSASGDEEEETTTAPPTCETTTTAPPTCETTTTAPPATTLPPPPEPTTGSPTTTAGPATTTAAVPTTTSPVATLKAPPADLPKTGGEARVTFWASMATGSGALLVVSLLALKRQKKGAKYV